MPVTYQYKIEDDHLHVVVKGSICSVDEMLGHIGNVHKERVKAGLSNLLINETKCFVHLSFDDVERLSCALLGLNWSEPKVAVVVADMSRPLFQHAFQAAVKIKFFTNEEEAKRWLAEE